MRVYVVYHDLMRNDVIETQQDFVKQATQFLNGIANKDNLPLIEPPADDCCREPVADLYLGNPQVEVMLREKETVRKWYGMLKKRESYRALVNFRIRAIGKGVFVISFEEK